MSKFSMKNEYYEIEIKCANANKIELEIIFTEKEIPEQEVRSLEQFLRLLLEACGRFRVNPSRR